MRYILLAVSVVVLSGCKSSTPASDAAPASASAESFSTLLPITLDPIQFNQPANQELIDQELAKLGHFTHGSQDFAGEMQEARHQLKIGNRGYARFLIRNASTSCISCHTQSDRGPHFLANPVSPYFTKLGSLDKANFLIAVWSFDGGLSEYEKAMNSPDAALLPFATLESATLRALAAAVRVKKDPALADRIVSRVMYSKWAPVYLQMSAAKWKAAIQEWKNSKTVPRSLEDAKILIGKAWTKQMESPLARSGLIESLRASALLHDLLAQKKPGKAYAETLYYAGLNAEVLKDLDPFQLNEGYFEACIRHFPYSETAKNCYLRLEGAELAQYGAFESMPIPQRERDALSALRKLAQPNEGLPSWMEWGKGND